MKIKRIALIIPHTDITLETDLQRELPSNYVIHTQRIWLDEVGEKAEKKMVDVELPKAIKYLKGITDFDYVIFGCTSASAVYGKKGLDRLERYISNEMGCKGISAFGAVLDQMIKKNIKTISLITPYPKPVNEFMISSLKDYAIKVLFHTGMGISEDTKISRIPTEDIVNEVINNKKNIIGSDLLFLSCTNFRAMEKYEEIERLVGIDTITSNQSVFNWIVSK